MKKLAVLVACLALVGNIAFGVFASSKVADTPAAHASADAVSSANVSEELRVDIDGDVAVRFWFGLLPTGNSAAGTHQRAVAIQANYVHGTTFLGRSSSLKALAADSVEAFDFSLSGFDVNLADPTAAPTHDGRAYSVRVSPKSGFTWGSVGSEQDLRVESSRVH